MRPLSYTLYLEQAASTVSALPEEQVGWVNGEYVHTGGINDVQWCVHAQLCQTAMVKWDGAEEERG